MNVPPARIEQLRFRDFRGIENATLDLPPSPLVVLVGANGSGKSTVLDGAAILLSRLAGRIKSEHGGGRAIEDDDIRNGASDAEIGIRLVTGSGTTEWTVVKTASGRAARERSELDQLRALAEPIRESFRADDEAGVETTALPVFVYYPTNRAVLDIPARVRRTHVFDGLAAYDDAFATAQTTFRLFFEWFRDREDVENESARDSAFEEDRQLTAVRRAIEGLMGGFTGLRVRRKPLQRMTIRKGSDEVVVSQLSDGEKVLLALAGDLARRLAMANPTGDPLDGAGVVLIDEIELHLHPRWQHRVVGQLIKTFPNCQFIVSTHSPAVLSHARNGTAILLRREETGVRAYGLDPYGQDANSLLDDVFDAPARTPEVQQDVDRLFALLREGDQDQARDLLESVERELGRTDPALTRARVMLWRPA